MALSDDVKERVSLVEVAGRVLDWDMRKSMARRGDWWAPCPFHAEKTSSFHVTEKAGASGQFYCFGCNAKGSVIDFVMQHDGVGFAEAVRRLADGAQIDRVLDPAAQAATRAARAKKQAAAEAEAEEAARKAHARARRLWAEASPDAPRLAEYLTGRGVRLDAIGGVPPTLRLHPRLTAYGDQGRPVWIGPAMVAAIGRGKLVGIHRTWIDGPARARTPDGAKVPKQMLGLTGGIFGQPVRLTPAAPGAPLVVGEGIETTLAGLTAHRLRWPARPVAAEAALTLGALCGPEDPAAPSPGTSARSGKALPTPRPDLAADRPGWLPPARASRVIVLADPSTKCPEAARLNAERALAKITAAARAWGGTASIAVPRGRWDHDDDFADLARMGEY
ncbi:hypothetical protein U879_05710 [Defluviimonas sp. 20V17]|uniref:CHC2 zinc finger n=1 Tax=Allgaiera indica TaxID=765699 RepID=A0AAN5A0A0_9RHOB|nr:CHC2 zinc finger domain-containing protein [Allgaiera indica]KDB04636.1 hypothetical protein U879_05710 [Defluviimonas sp. 20V17]GHE03742.1 hypothetical protein GCM10008024_28310 [Allgaiera indica]SDX73600.1 CHC2 zinc finger [Allgaiera indica]